MGWGRQVDRGKPPITCQRCQGRRLINSRPLGFHSRCLSLPSPSLCGPHRSGREKGEVRRGCPCPRIPPRAPPPLYVRRPRWLLSACQRGCHSLRQRHAVQEISIRWAGPHSTDTTTSSRSQQITFSKLTACYHSG